MKKILIGVLAVVLTACGRSAPAASGGRLRVVATTTLVADVAQQVGGEWVAVQSLLPPGSDPHGFTPAPQDMAAVADADLILANGLGLEEFLAPLLESAGAADRLVDVSDGVPLQRLEAAFSSHAADEPGPTDIDPHVWTDPNNVAIWAQNMAEAFSQADPAHAEDYRANAAAYRVELQALDAWIRTQVARLPDERRRLVTDHLVWGYFAERYGFEQVGALVGAFSSNASPSAQELAALEAKIRALGVPAIVIGVNSNRALAEQVARDTGVEIVPVYTGSLSASDGPAASYLDFMRYNVTVIVAALQGE